MIQHNLTRPKGFEQAKILKDLYKTETNVEIKILQVSEFFCLTNCISLKSEMPLARRGKA